MPATKTLKWTRVSYESTGKYESLVWSKCQKYVLGLELNRDFTNGRGYACLRFDPSLGKSLGDIKGYTMFIGDTLLNDAKFWCEKDSSGDLG